MRNQDLGRFLTSLFGEIDGYIYVPVKYSDGLWERHFFKWPVQRDEVEDFIDVKQKASDVYISPSLWKIDPGESKLTKDHWLGTQHLWADFDGRLPSDLKGIPNPSIKVRTSGPENHHWYWRLSYFETNADKLEVLNKKLTYSLEGDMSSWDYVQVLRPPCTKNQKENKGQTTQLLKCSSSAVNLEPIVNLEDPPQSSFIDENDLNLSDIPSPLDIVGKCTWSDSILSLLTSKKIPKDRSKAMFAVACWMIKENKSSNLEVLSIIKWLDGRWAKFSKRDDQIKVLFGMIANARLSTGVKEDEPEETENDEDLLKHIFNAISVSENLKPVEFIVDKLLTANGITEFVAKSGIGKTRLTSQLAICLGLGERFLSFEIKKPKKVVVIHNEMLREEYDEFHKPMMGRLDKERQMALKDNYLTVFMPDKFLIKTDEDYKRLIKLINLTEPDVLIFDTLIATAGDPSNFAEMKAFFDMMDRMRSETGVGAIINHHNRKGVVGNPRPKYLDDVYGAKPVTQAPNTIIGLWREEDSQKEAKEGELPTEFYPIKQRLRARFMPVYLKSNQHAGFSLIPDKNPAADIEEFVEQTNDFPIQRRQKPKRNERKKSVADFAEADFDDLDF